MARQGIKARTQGKASRQGIKASARQGRKASAIAIGMPSACHHRHRQLPSARHRSARHRSARHHRHRSSASRQGIIGKASASSASACRQGIGMPSSACHRHRQDAATGRRTAGRNSSRDAAKWHKILKSVKIRSCENFLE